MSRREEAARPPVEVDMTPLIDVTFLLLVFFMMISTLSDMERTAVLELPMAYQAMIETGVAKERMIVNVERDGTIVMFGQRVMPDEFRTKLRAMGPMLRRLGEATGRAPIVLRGDRDCEFVHIKGILAAIAEEQFDTIMFAAYQREAGETPEP